MAVFEPIVRSKKFRAHGIDSIWNLEPSEFSTHLPHPLSTIIVYVISDVLKYTSIVSVNIIITLSCPLLNYWKLLLHTSCCDTVKNIAHLFTLPVLNTASEYICNKGHEITHRKSASTEYWIDVLFIFITKLAWNCLFNIGCNVMNNFRAAFPASESCLVKVKVIHRIILYSMNDTGRRPCSISSKWILRLEPCRQGARIAASYCQPLAHTWPVYLIDLGGFGLHKVVKISKGLGGVEIFEIINRPVPEWLWSTIVSVFKY